VRTETTTRLRNAFAQAAADALDAPAARPASAASALPFTSMTEADWRQAVRLWKSHAAELIAAAPSRPCPACGGGAARFLFFSYDAHPFHECDRCGCWFEPKTIDPALFDRFFARCPEAGALAARMTEARDRDEGRDADMARIGGYLDDLRAMLPQGAGPLAYLDAGCGVGHSLRAGLARGLRVQGVEVDPAAIALARADGLPVVTPNETVPPGPYHLLSFWETLEHIADPLAALQRYLPLLADDGLVAITVPNLNALATRVLRESCPWVHGGYNTPGHVNLFHAASIERLLSRAGLTLLDADGQFSANPIELFATLHGATRGALDNLAEYESRGTLPATVAEALAALWPGVTLVERLALASPILSVVACRTGREARFAPAVAAARQRRREQILAATADLMRDETDYRAVSESLQLEIDRREAEAAATIEQLQEEINRRDREHAEMVGGLQAAIDRRDREHAEKTDRLQGAVNLRDDLLEKERAKFNRTIEGLFFAGARALGRAVRRVTGGHSE
jgi:SAM-dependent methyltransferase